MTLPDVLFCLIIACREEKICFTGYTWGKNLNFFQ